MPGKKETDVLVVGAGPVGMFTALMLSLRGIGVQIIDEQWRPAAHSYALALHPGSLGLLDQLGLANAVIERCHRVEKVAFYEGASRLGEISLLDLAVDFPFVAVLAQSDLEGLLEKQLAKRGIKIAWKHRLSDVHTEGQHVFARIDQLGKSYTGYAVAALEWGVEKTLQTKASFVIGADGHNSFVRRLLDIDYKPAADRQLFAVFEFQSDEAATDEVRLVLDETTTNVLWPLPGNRCRWSFQLLDEKIPDEMRAKQRIAVLIGKQVYTPVTEQRLKTFIHDRAPWFEGRVGELHWSIVVQFQPRLASAYGRDRFWLVGDAAHQTGPAGMQSMNVGLSEANELADKIARILRENASPDLLESYNRDRLRQWRHLLGIEGRLSPTPQAEPWVKQRCDRLLPCIPASGDDLVQLARQIGLDLALAT
jgi:2-polyprenyl-6-methoxyphenol hydroxylase-like FAD-dependent oxidoreductase